MSEVVLNWFVLLTPLVLAACAAALAWRKVKRPLLFLCVAVFILLAIQVVVFLFIGARLPPGEPRDAYVLIGVAADALAVILGCPLLWWLYRGSRYGGKSAGGA